MDLASLKEQLRDLVLGLLNRLQNSSAFQNLKEQYQALPTGVQRLVILGSGVLLSLLVLSIPFSFLSASSDLVSEYNDKHQLLRDLRRVARDANLPPPLPPTPGPGELEGQMQNALAPFGLLPEQFGGIFPLEPNPAGNLVNKRLGQNGVSVNLKKLNLRQTLDIGANLQSLNPGLRMLGVELTANAQDPLYYDVTYKLVSFSLNLSPGVGASDAAGSGGDGERGSEEEGQ